LKLNVLFLAQSNRPHTVAAINYQPGGSSGCIYTARADLTYFEEKLMHLKRWKENAKR